MSLIIRLIRANNLLKPSFLYIYTTEESVQNEMELDMSEYNSSVAQNNQLNSDVNDEKDNQVRILVVDDNEMNRKVIYYFLRNTSAIIEDVDNGEAAVELCKSKRYDVVLMDHIMPGLDGVEAMKLIRDGDGPNKDTCIIALTANEIEDGKDIYEMFGFDDYISKPANAEALKQMIQDYLPEGKRIL